MNTEIISCPSARRSTDQDMTKDASPSLTPARKCSQCKAALRMTLLWTMLAMLSGSVSAFPEGGRRVPSWRGDLPYTEGAVGTQRHTPSETRLCTHRNASKVLRSSNDYLGSFDPLRSTSDFAPTPSPNDELCNTLSGGYVYAGLPTCSRNHALAAFDIIVMSAGPQEIIHTRRTGKKRAPNPASAPVSAHSVSPGIVGWIHRYRADTMALPSYGPASLRVHSTLDGVPNSEKADTPRSVCAWKARKRTQVGSSYDAKLLCYEGLHKSTLYEYEVERQYSGVWFYTPASRPRRECAPRHCMVVISSRS